MMTIYTLYGEVDLSSSDLEAATASPSGDSSSSWALLDTGASHHMFNDESLFVLASIKLNDNPSHRLKLLVVCLWQSKPQGPCT